MAGRRTSRAVTVAGLTVGWLAPGGLTTVLLTVVQKLSWQPLIKLRPLPQITLVEQKTTDLGLGESNIVMTSQRVGTTISRAEVVERHEVIRVSFRRVIETLSNVIVSF